MCVMHLVYIVWEALVFCMRVHVVAMYVDIRSTGGGFFLFCFICVSFPFRCVIEFCCSALVGLWPDALALCVLFFILLCNR